MNTVNASQGNAGLLPPSLRTAQAAIDLPEVQQMLRKLAEYQLGIFMPHTHGEHTGEFQPLPDELVQVESGLAVSFRPTAEIALQSDRFLPVGWVWRAGKAAPAAACEMISEVGSGDERRSIKHKMP